MRGGIAGNRLIGENALDRRLRIIEIAANGDGVDVWLRGGGHLQALNARGADVREEHGDLGAGDACETVHGGRARVAARGGKDKDAAAGRGVTHEYRQHRKRNILERAGRAVKELEDVHRSGLDYGRWRGRREARKEPFHSLGAHFFRKIAEEDIDHISFGRGKVGKDGKRG